MTLTRVVTDDLAYTGPEFIKFPTDVNAIRKNNFFEIAGFPGVVGCLDCTHVRMLSPKGLDKAQFYCRKGYPSLNVQAVCDSTVVS